MYDLIIFIDHLYKMEHLKLWKKVFLLALSLAIFNYLIIWTMNIKFTWMRLRSEKDPIFYQSFRYDNYFFNRTGKAILYIYKVNI